jgi:hypothetical protein
MLSHFPNVLGFIFMQFKVLTCDHLYVYFQFHRQIKKNRIGHQCSQQVFVFTNSTTSMTPLYRETDQ